MSDHNPKAMNKEELEKYIEKDFLPGLLSSLPNVPDLTGENARLKAEVERLEGLVKYWQIEAETDHAHWVRHAETNERLRKAGDYMADHLAHEFGTCPSIEAWNAAKEGKPSV